MTLDDQRNMMERALGERMLNHAFVFLHQWCKELNSTMYSDRIQSIEQNYKYLFDYYLSSDDPDRDRLLDAMTGDTYRLMDEMYTELRLKRGEVPEMLGFDKENTESTLRYFSSCVRLQDEDLDWLIERAHDATTIGTSLLIMAALVQNLRANFSEKAILCLIDIIEADNSLLRDQALASVILLLAHYDVRIDFFPDIQNAFVERIGDGEHAYEILRALTKSTRDNLKEIIEREDISTDEMPNEIKELMGDAFGVDSLNEIVESMPLNENEYMSELIALLPNTWVFDVIVGDDSERIQKIARAYLNAGMMDLMWDNLEEAEEILVRRLRSNHPTPQDYINYGHICFLHADRLLAYENYREAKRMLNSTKKFLTLFRPDRRMLVDNGVSLDEVYLMEDQLLRKE